MHTGQFLKKTLLISMIPGGKRDHGLANWQIKPAMPWELKQIHRISTTSCLRGLNKGQKQLTQKNRPRKNYKQLLLKNIRFGVLLLTLCIVLACKCNGTRDRSWRAKAKSKPVKTHSVVLYYRQPEQDGTNQRHVWSRLSTQVRDS